MILLQGTPHLAESGCSAENVRSKNVGQRSRFCRIIESSIKAFNQTLEYLEEVGDQAVDEKEIVRLSGY